MPATSDLSIEQKDFANNLRQEAPVDAAVRIFARTFVGYNGANVRPLQAGDAFAGIAVRQEDNRDGVAGDKRAMLETRFQMSLDVTGAGAGSAGDLVYASDDATATSTATSNTLIGRLEQQISGTKWWVRIFTPGESGQFGA